MAYVDNHPDFDKFQPIWKKCKDVIEGEDALKQADRNKQGTYLRPLNPSDKSAYNVARNKSYINMARFQNYTAKTEAGWLGMAFRLPPTIENIPSEIEYLAQDADGSWLSLEQQSRNTLKHIIDFGRCGLLTDMPAFEGQATRADVENGYRANIKLYSADSIRDWSPENPNRFDPLSFVKLRETFVYWGKDGDPTKKGNGERFLILKLVDGVYVQEVWEKREEDEEHILIKEIYPRRSNGSTFDYIPFDFVGSLNNTPKVDKPMVLDLANANLGMYQEDANLRISSFGFSAVTPHIADDQYFQRHNMVGEDGEEQTVEFGEDSLIITGSGGAFNLVAPPENPLAQRIKESDRQDLIGLGAQVIVPGGGAETAEAVRIKKGDSASLLSIAVQNVSNAYMSQLENVAEFMGATIANDTVIALNEDFFYEDLTPEMARELVATWQNGVISKDVLDQKLVKGGIIPSGTDLEIMNGALETELDTIPTDSDLNNVG
jgi:hypothetical protein